MPGADLDIRTEQNKTGKKNIHFVINPVSGPGRRKDIINAVERHIDRSRYEFSVSISESRGHATQLAERAVADQADAIVVAGGDGSINEVARSITGTPVALGILPSGSGNGLAHHLHLPFRLNRALEMINAFRIKTIDTIKINDLPCVSIAGVGFDAQIARKFAESNERGFQTYFRIILNEYPFYKPDKYRFSIDGRSYREKALFICFANSNQFGNNVFIAPNAEVDDGLIDVCVVRKIPMAQVFLLVNLLFLKQIEKSKFVRIYRGKHISLKGNTSGIVNLDGEMEKMGETLEISINPGSLNVIVP
jgi:YegS/Rv2252/BmrU family lipid kinase